MQYTLPAPGPQPSKLHFMVSYAYLYMIYPPLTCKLEAISIISFL